MDPLKFVFTINFLIAVPNNSYFIIMGNRTSANLYRKDGYIELLLIEKECYEKFHTPIGSMTSFEYNWMNKSIDGAAMTRYEGNCNITSFDFEGAAYNKACMEYSHETLDQKFERIDLEYFICFLIPILLLSRADILINAIKKSRIAADQPLEYRDDDSYVTMV